MFFDINKKSFINYIIYSFLFLIFFLIQNTPNSIITIFNVKPFLILSLITFITIYNHDIVFILFSLISGFLCDLSSNKILGYNAIIILIIMILVKYILVKYLNNNFLGNLLICLIVCISYQVIDFIFLYFIWGYENSFYFFIRYKLPIVAYTTLISPIILIIVKKLNIKS